LLADEVDVAAEAGADALAALPELVEGVDAVLEVPAVSEEPPAALSAAVTAGATSLVLALPLSPPPLLRKSVTYQPEPLS
jgi:hypothetical protein